MVSWCWSTSSSPVISRLWELSILSLFLTKYGSGGGSKRTKGFWWDLRLNNFTQHIEQLFFPFSIRCQKTRKNKALSEKNKKQEMQWKKQQHCVAKLIPFMKCLILWEHVTYVSFVISLKFVLQSGLPDVAMIHISVVNWGGEEVARVEVLPSDTVLVGQLQIEDQIGVPPKNNDWCLGKSNWKRPSAGLVCWTLSRRQSGNLNRALNLQILLI